MKVDSTSTEHNEPNERNAVEQERLRIAHDLHDDLGSQLIAVKMAMAQLARGLPKDNPALLAAASRTDKLVDQAIDAMHRVLHDLRPQELDLGLVAALQQMASDYQAEALPCHFTSNQAEIDASPELTLTLLRICREALTNISKHASAGRVFLHLTQQRDDTIGHRDDGPDWLQLDIIDDGRGYPGNAPDGASIRRRVQTLGGTLERQMTAGIDAGCHLRIRIPLHCNPVEADKIAR